MSVRYVPRAALPAGMGDRKEQSGNKKEDGCVELALSVLYGGAQQFHMVAAGLNSSVLGCLLTLLVYTYCQRYQQQSHDATVIHTVSPAALNSSITNHINKLEKYDSVEAIKVRNEH